jgi:hypothetical protein
VVPRPQPRTRRAAVFTQRTTSHNRSNPAIAACATPLAPPGRAQQTVERFYELWNAGDVEGVIDCFADTAVYHDAIYLEPFFGKDAIAAYFRKFAAEGLAALQFNVAEIVGDDERCATAWCAAWAPVSASVMSTASRPPAPCPLLGLHCEL